MGVRGWVSLLSACVRGVVVGVGAMNIPRAIIWSRKEGLQRTSTSESVWVGVGGWVGGQAVILHVVVVLECRCCGINVKPRTEAKVPACALALDAWVASRARVCV
jgi:hypothetical protein